MRAQAATELLVGVLLGAAGVFVLRATALGAGQPKSEGRAPVPVEPATTLRPSAPPREVGPAYDDDDAMPKAATPVASYTMNAKLDEDSHTVFGEASILWKNASSEPASELWFHLYLNAFKNDQTLFLRSRFSGGRSGKKTSEWGWVDVKKLTVQEHGATDLWPGRDRHSPGDPKDETDIRVPLAEPVPAGGKITIELEFESRLPDIIARTGHHGSFYMVAQWFPKLARREPDGTWVHFPFHAQSEFYADYGRYDVTLDVPRSFVVGATGSRLEETIEGGRKVVRHVQTDVHDFAWTAWDRFEVHSETIDSVDVRLLYPPGHDKNRSITMDALRFSLPHFNARYGRYPYPVLTVVHPPSAASNAGGMEYPTLITTGGPWYIGALVRGVEAVTIHELGHQWFYGLIATNEHAWPFLDEGLNSYAEGVAMSERYGAGSIVDFFGLRVTGRNARRAFAAARAHDDVVALPADQFSSFRSLGALVYGRTATALTTTANVHSEEKVRKALGRYCRYYRFAHPEPKHFLAVMREVLGDEATENLRLALFERGWVDYVVRDLESAPARPPAGVFDKEDGRQTIDRNEEKTDDSSFVGRVLVHRHGTLRLPVDVDLVTEDGTRIRKTWDGRGRWTAMAYSGRSRLVGAIVDPENKITLDQNLLNNATSTEPGGTPRTLERATFLAQLLLHFGGP